MIFIALSLLANISAYNGAIYILGTAGLVPRAAGGKLISSYLILSYGLFVALAVLFFRLNQLAGRRVVLVG
jgi:hypothetical protein